MSIFITRGLLRDTFHYYNGKVFIKKAAFYFTIKFVQDLICLISFSSTLKFSSVFDLFAELVLASVILNTNVMFSVTETAIILLDKVMYPAS